MLCQNWWEQAVCDRSTETWRSWLLLWGSQLQGVQGDKSCSFFLQTNAIERKMKKIKESKQCQVWMQLHPDQRQALESPVTIVKRIEQAAQYPVSSRLLIFYLTPNLIWPTWPNSYFENKKKIKGATWSRALQWGIQRPSEQICRLPQRGETFLWFKNRFYSSLS